MSRHGCDREEAKRASKKAIYVLSDGAYAHTSTPGSGFRCLNCCRMDEERCLWSTREELRQHLKDFHSPLFDDEEFLHATADRAPWIVVRDGPVD